MLTLFRDFERSIKDAKSLLLFILYHKNKKSHEFVRASQKSVCCETFFSRIPLTNSTYSRNPTIAINLLTLPHLLTKPTTELALLTLLTLLNLLTNPTNAINLLNLLNIYAYTYIPTYIYIHIHAYIYIYIYIYCRLSK